MMVMCRAVIGSLAHRVEDWQFWSTAQMYTALMERSGRGLAKRCAIGTVLFEDGTSCVACAASKYVADGAGP